MNGVLADTQWVRKRADVQPDAYHYRDTGCKLAPACLQCPLKACQYDTPRRTQRRINRDRKVLALSESEGLSAAELAKRFNVSTRTIDRAIKDQPSTPAILRHKWRALHRLPE